MSASDTQRLTIRAMPTLYIVFCCILALGAIAWALHHAGYLPTRSGRAWQHHRHSGRHTHRG